MWIYTILGFFMLFLLQLVMLSAVAPVPVVMDIGVSEERGANSLLLTPPPPPPPKTK
jgi:hypothetical protein